MDNIEENKPKNGQHPATHGVLRSIAILLFITIKCFSIAPILGFW